MPFETVANVTTRSWAGRLLGGCVALQGLGLAIGVDDAGIRWVAGIAALVSAVVVNHLWHRWPPAFARDVVLITAAVGGLGMLLGSAVDTWRAPPDGSACHVGAESGKLAHSMDPRDHAMHSADADTTFDGTTSHNVVAHGTASHEDHHGTQHGDGEGASVLDGALLHLTAAPGMLVGMMLFCVPGCLLLCRPCAARSTPWRWLAHGACMLGMLVGMVLGAAWPWPSVLAWAPDTLGHFADHHVRMLVGMAFGSGVVALLASHWPRPRLAETVHG
ncbi:MAG: hypothetical protein AAGE94_19660 [Acidobacteriota bacterium]